MRDHKSAVQAERLTDLILKDLPIDPVWIGPAVLPKNSKLIFGGPAAIGKALGLDEPVLTKLGWKAIKDICVGDELVSLDDTPSFVTGVYPHTEKQLFKVTFSDGRSVICCDEHLWSVSHAHNSSWRKPRILSLAAVQAYTDITRLYIPCGQIQEAQTFESVPAIDPWLLGVLLGDGCFRTPTAVTFASWDTEIADRVRTLVPITLVSRINPIANYRIKDKGFIKKALQHLELFGKLSIEKHIPNVYKYGSRQTRLEIIRGLVDTDGSVSKRGTLSIITSSPQLAIDIQYVLRSLGFLASVTSRIPYYCKNGVRIFGKRAYRISARGENVSDLVWLPRKKIRCRSFTRKSRLSFKSIEPVPPGPAVCISVSHPSSLFITRDFIVTHNSMVLLSLARALALGETPLGCPLFTVVRPIRTLLVEHELKPYGLQQRVKKIFAGVELAQLEDMLWYVSGEPTVQFSSPEGVKILERLVATIKPEVLILDPIGKMHYYDENDNSGIAKLMYQIDLLLRQGFDWGMSVMFSHHFGKPSDDPRAAGNRDVLDPYNFRGAAKWKDDPDVRVTMQKLEHLAVPHHAWRIKTRWLTRQGEQMPDIYFTVNKNDDMRVYFEKFDTSHIQGGVKPLIPTDKKIPEAPNVPSRITVETSSISLSEDSLPDNSKILTFQSGPKR